MSDRVDGDDVSGPAIFAADLEDGEAKADDPVEKGPLGAVKEIRSMDDFAREYGYADSVSMTKDLRRRVGYASGSFMSILTDVECYLDEIRPAAVPVAVVRRMLAEHWLGRPQGVFARLRWAAKLLFES